VSDAIVSPLPIEEDMPLRKEHEKLIRAEVERQISQLVDSFRPHGWRKLTYWIREWGGVGAVIGVFLALIVICITIGIYAVSGLTTNAEFRTHTEDRLTGIEAAILKINSTLDGAKLKQIGADPTNPENIAQAKNVLIAAVSNGTKIDPNIVKDVGGKFIDAAEQDPTAWNTVLAFMNYKSFLDASSAQSLSMSVSTKPFTTHYSGVAPPGDKLPTARVPDGIAVPIEQAARFSPLGEYPNKGLMEGNPLFILDGGGIVIDGMDMKNVVLHGVHIVYHGGPLKMSNVYFANCVFDVTRERPGESFAAIFLKSGPATSFTSA